jgi:pre-mRNA-splicing factor SYF1
MREQSKGPKLFDFAKIYERALRELPGSYKLWHAYLLERVLAVRGRKVTDPSFEAVNNTFERALVFMHKVQLSECFYLY